MSIDEYFTNSNSRKNNNIHFSPSGNYKLIIENYATKPGCWDYSRGMIYKKNSDVCIADVKRNYGMFPYSWIENHTNGHDYLICGSNYQGQTVIELDRNKRIDYIPKEADNGSGFCWSKHYPSLDGKLLAVEGCFWGSNYEIVIYDFSNPMEPPWLELNRNNNVDDVDFVEWIDNNSCKIRRTYEWNKLLNKAKYELTDKEIDEMDKIENEDFKKIWETKTDSIIWKKN